MSTKGRYGLRAMIDLAVNSSGDFVPLSTIADRQKISLNYLEHSFSALKKAGLITGLTGSRGGYKLNYPPEEITIKMILNVLEGELNIVSDTHRNGDSLLEKCIRNKVWDRVNADVDNLISTTTLKDLISKGDS